MESVVTGEESRKVLIYFIMFIKLYKSKCYNVESFFWFCGYFVRSGGGGSAYSSPRSSIGSGGGYDSKGSSPHSSIVISHPPLPHGGEQRFGGAGGSHEGLHHRAFGGPHSIVISPRSGASSPSGESRSTGGSPRWGAHSVWIYSVLCILAVVRFMQVYEKPIHKVCRTIFLRLEF